jgi:hypothetical protein
MNNIQSNGIIQDLSGNQLTLPNNYNDEQYQKSLKKLNIYIHIIELFKNLDNYKNLPQYSTSVEKRWEAKPFQSGWYTQHDDKPGEPYYTVNSHLYRLSKETDEFLVYFPRTFNWWNKPEKETYDLSQDDIVNKINDMPNLIKHISATNKSCVIL